jgi:hypothetical protein
MALPTRSSFYGSTSLPSDPPVVTGMSWSAGYQWPLKGRLMSGSWACHPKPSHHGGIYANGSSTSSLPLEAPSGAS